MAKYSKNNPPLEALENSRDGLMSKDLADVDTFPEKKVRSLLKFYIREGGKAYKARDAARAEVAERKDRVLEERAVFTADEVVLSKRGVEWGAPAKHLVDARALTRLRVPGYVAG